MSTVSHCDDSIYVLIIIIGYVVIALVIEQGLIDSGRRVKLSLNLPDRPGSLSHLMTLISKSQANV